MPRHVLIPNSRRQILMMMLIAASTAVLLTVLVPYYTRRAGSYRVGARAKMTATLGDLVAVDYDVIKLTRNSTEDSSLRQQCYGPVDQGQLTANFAQLTAVVSTTVDPFLAKMTSPKSGRKKLAKSLMRVTRPQVNCSSWQLTSPSGRRRYTRQDLLTIAREEDENSDGAGDAAEAGIPPLLPVPNVAHFVLPFADPRLRFHHLVSILSCVWLMRPRLLFLWHATNRLPVGRNWQLLRQNLTAAAAGNFWESRVVLASRDLPTSVYGARMAVPEHQSDMMRLEAVLAFGGAYFDVDVLVLKRLEPLRRFPFVIGRQTSVGLCNGAFLAEPGNLMLAMWHLAYQTFDDRWWALHSVTLPQSICAGAGGFPQLCHIEPESMQKPSWTPDELPWIYGPRRVWDWRAKNYMVHLWYRFHKVEYNMSSVRRVDSMLGDMLRFVLFGSEALVD